MTGGLVRWGGVLALLLTAYPAAAQQVPALTGPSASVAAANPGLADRYAGLLQNRATLKAAIDRLNARCSAVEEGSADEPSCRAEQSSLSSALAAHIQDSKAFNAAVQSAIDARAATDASVVDARDVPSGLPKSVDTAIASVYGTAPPGVADRVRKGYQAVMARDWKVAKAWFQDALNHDPGNEGLKHFVALSDYTNTQAVRPLPRKDVQMPTDADMELLFPGWRPPKAGSGQLQLPKDQDMQFLFPGSAEDQRRAEARALNDYVFEQALKATENDPVLLRVSNRLVDPNRKPPDIHN